MGKKQAARVFLQGKACGNRAPMESNLLNHASLPGQRSDSRKADRFSCQAGNAHRERGYDPSIEPRMMGTLLSGKISVQQARVSREEQESGLSPVIFRYSLIIEHIPAGSSLYAISGDTGIMTCRQNSAGPLVTDPAPDYPCIDFSACGGWSLPGCQPSSCWSSLNITVNPPLRVNDRTGSSVRTPGVSSSPTGKNTRSV